MFLLFLLYLIKNYYYKRKNFKALKNYLVDIPNLFQNAQEISPRFEENFSAKNDTNRQLFKEFWSKKTDKDQAYLLRILKQVGYMQHQSINFVSFYTLTHFLILRAPRKRKKAQEINSKINKDAGSIFA